MGRSRHHLKIETRRATDEAELMRLYRCGRLSDAAFDAACRRLDRRADRLAERARDASRRAAPRIPSTSLGA